MGLTSKNILTVNSGSSSIKLDLFLIDPTGITNASSERVIEASITGIGQAKARLSVRQLPADKQTSELEVTDHAAAIHFLMEWLSTTIPTHNIMAVGHRVVHGGPNHNQPELITDALEQELQSYTSLDPEHTPAALKLIHALRQHFPGTPQVACFDTAYFHDLPRVAQLLPIPYTYQAEGLRRYGFHGLSYTSLDLAFRRLAGDDAANGRVIYAHLGSGASLAAVRDGKPIDTSMSFTPASGIPMSTRSGDMDPGVSRYLQLQHGVSPEQYDHMVNFESGLLGVSGVSADMYTLLQSEETNERASDAVNLFVYQVKKTIGAFSAALGGVDSLVFSGGIGEQAPAIRARICDGLDYLGIDIDSSRNDQHASLISSDSSRTGVHVIPTDEAMVICGQVVDGLSKSQNGET